MAAAAVGIVVLGAVLLFHVAAPAQPGGLVLSAPLATVAIFALGLRSVEGTFPAAQPLLLMAACAVVFGFAALRLFRWE